MPEPMSEARLAEIEADLAEGYGTADETVGDLIAEVRRLREQMKIHRIPPEQTLTVVAIAPSGRLYVKDASD